MSDHEWTAEPIGHVIRRAREQHGLTQDELADALNRISGHSGVTWKHISRWEGGGRIPDSRSRGHLSEALGLPRELLERAAAIAKARSLLDGAQ